MGSGCNDSWSQADPDTQTNRKVWCQHAYDAMKYVERGVRSVYESSTGGGISGSKK